MYAILFLNKKKFIVFEDKPEEIGCILLLFLGGENIKYHDGQYVTVIQANKLHYETIRAFFHSFFLCFFFASVVGWDGMNKFQDRKD